MQILRNRHLSACLVWTSAINAPFVVSASCPAPGTALSLTGSWVVQPIVSLWADFFDCPGVAVDVERSSNEEGITRVCGQIADPTDMGVATRLLREDEATPLPGTENQYYQCAGSDRQVVGIDVALDGLVIVTVLGGTANNCLRALESVTVDQVRWMFSNWTEAELIQSGTWDRAAAIPNSDGNPFTRNWCELSTACPCVPIQTAGASPGTRAHQYMQVSSGFTTDTEGFRGSYTAFPDTADLVSFLDTNPAAVGYMRFAEYSIKASLMLDAVPVVDPSTREAVRPTAATITGDQYNPYSRRAYMYVWTEAIDEVLPFLEFGFSELGTSLVDQVNLVPLPLTERQGILAELQQEQDPSMSMPPPTTVEEPSMPTSRGAPSTTWPHWLPLLLVVSWSHSCLLHLIR